MGSFGRTDKKNIGIRLIVNNGIKNTTPKSFKNKHKKKQKKKIGFWRDAEKRNKIEKNYKDYRPSNKRKRKSFKKFGVIFKNFLFIKIGNIENNQPKGKKKRKGDKMNRKFLKDFFRITNGDDKEKTGKKNSDIA